ncbi:MAG: hypothetical protein LBB38_03895 [Puniceicoccales bacterium]|nr:hypothetical protein [Puniceicoccales bacterium]
MAPLRVPSYSPMPPYHLPAPEVSNKQRATLLWRSGHRIEAIGTWFKHIFGSGSDTSSIEFFISEFGPKIMPPDTFGSVTIGDVLTHQIDGKAVLEIILETSANEGKFDKLLRSLEGICATDRCVLDSVLSMNADEFARMYGLKLPDVEALKSLQDGVRRFTDSDAAAPLSPVFEVDPLHDVDPTSRTAPVDMKPYAPMDFPELSENFQFGAQITFEGDEHANRVIEGIRALATAYGVSDEEALKDASMFLGFCENDWRHLAGSFSGDVIYCLDLKNEGFFNNNAGKILNRMYLLALKAPDIFRSREMLGLLHDLLDRIDNGKYDVDKYHEYTKKIETLRGVVDGSLRAPRTIDELRERLIMAGVGSDHVEVLLGLPDRIAMLHEGISSGAIKTHSEISDMINALNETGYGMDVTGTARAEELFSPKVRRAFAGLIAEARAKLPLDEREKLEAELYAILNKDHQLFGVESEQIRIVLPVGFAAPEDVERMCGNIQNRLLAAANDDRLFISAAMHAIKYDEALTICAQRGGNTKSAVVGMLRVMSGRIERLIGEGLVADTDLAGKLRGLIDAIENSHMLPDERLMADVTNGTLPNRRSFEDIKKLVSLGHSDLAVKYIAKTAGGYNDKLYKALLDEFTTAAKARKALELVKTLPKSSSFLEPISIAKFTKDLLEIEQRHIMREVIDGLHLHKTKAEETLSESRMFGDEQVSTLEFCIRRLGAPPNPLFDRGESAEVRLEKQQIRETLVSLLTTPDALPLGLRVAILERLCDAGHYELVVDSFKECPWLFFEVFDTKKPSPRLRLFTASGPGWGYTMWRLGSDLVFCSKIFNPECKFGLESLSRNFVVSYISANKKHPFVKERSGQGGFFYNRFGVKLS